MAGMPNALDERATGRAGRSVNFSHLLLVALVTAVVTMAAMIVAAQVGSL